MEIFNIVLLGIFGIIGVFLLIKFMKCGIDGFSDKEIMETYTFKECFFALLLLFWIILMSKGIMLVTLEQDKIFSPEIINSFSEIEVNMDALTQNLPILIIMVLIAFLIIFIIPIICLIHYAKHKKKLKEYSFKNTNYKKVARTHFFMSLFSPIFVPLFIFPSMMISFFSKGKNGKGYSKYYTTVKDSKGNTTYIDTIIDNDTGLGTTKVQDEKGNKSIHYTDRY